MSRQAEMEERILNAVTEEISNWLLKECVKIFGKEKLKGVKDIQLFLENEGYRVNMEKKGTTASCELYKGDQRISFFNLDIMTLAMKLAKNK